MVGYISDKSIMSKDFLIICISLNSCGLPFGQTMPVITYYLGSLKSITSFFSRKAISLEEIVVYKSTTRYLPKTYFVAASLGSHVVSCFVPGGSQELEKLSPGNPYCFPSPSNAPNMCPFICFSSGSFTVGSSGAPLLK
jgi:hypothetical protein